ncbi:glycosyltransferase [Hymenobacter sp. BT186]|uniref:Glycosyltransferase n=1 Tax=Hymenobacter telluris TaxID=2816474 RepID=A0A939ESS3_9BACT|nr:glycosyltransferase [Hymenobacter telluris]MBO0356793.1 glycosyltransferase [Hymenobacter telluris]MBW3372819.1 glycosyltransferase [Hymenobacter norwichensis]
MPRLSVLMPVYNAEKFLAEAIDSILQQTFTDFEFIVIDDCSTDSSVAIVESYQDTRIRLYRNASNSGISYTLNRGIELAATDLIARMDADDISYPQRLQLQYDYLLAHPDCAMVSSFARMITEEKEVIRIDDFKSKLYYYNLTFSCWIYHPTVVYRKQAVQQVGMYSVPYAEDFDLWWQLSRLFVITTLPEVLLDYRVTSQSLHQVQKRQEYTQAQQDQILRNIRYYAGPEYYISANHVECLQHNFQPLLDEQSVSSVLECLRKLDFISSCILEKENPNLDKEDVVEGAFYKKLFIAHYYIDHLPKLKAALLAAKLGLFKKSISVLIK